MELEPVIEAAILMAEPYLERQARLVREYDSVPRVYGNRAGYTRLFFNLLVHAARAVMSDGGARQTIVVKRYVRGPKVHVQVQHPGAPIGEAALHAMLHGTGGSVTVEVTSGLSVATVALPVV